MSNTAMMGMESKPHFRHRGFTLIELVMVIVLVGVLAVVAAPRFADSGDFDAVGYAHRLEGLIRYAQKTAIAQRQLVRVDISNTPNAADPTLTWAAASTAGCTAALIATAVPLPSIGKRPTSAVTVSTTPANITSFCFDPLGRPYANGSPLAPLAQLTLSVSNSSGQVIRTFFLETSTGYLHE